MSDTEKQPEVWTYAGVRAGGQGKRFHEWIDPEGKARWYGDTGSFAIGGLYDFLVTRTAQHVLRTTPRYTGDLDPDDEKRRQWAALHQAALTELAGQKLARNAAKRDELAELVDPLVELAAQLSTGPERDALTAYVLRRISAAW